MRDGVYLKKKTPSRTIRSPRRRGAGGGTRTHTVSLPTDFESVTSTNSITPANDTCLLYKMLFQNSREIYCKKIKMNRPLKDGKIQRKATGTIGNVLL